MRYFVDRMIGLIAITVVVLVGLIFYNSYKYLVWPHVPAVVTSIKSICVYAKKSGRRSTIRKYLSCGADSEATAAGLMLTVTSLSPTEKRSSRRFMKRNPGERPPQL